MKTKTIIVLILIVLFTIFVTQNTQPVDVNVLFWKFSSPEIIIIVLTGVVGVLIGLILASIFHPSKKKKTTDNVPLPQNTGKNEDDSPKVNV